MKKVIVILATLFSIIGCGILNKPKPQPETTMHYTYKDSTVIKDSIRVVDLPVERIVDKVAVYDTLELETSFAKSRAWVDTTNHLLAGNIENKPQANVRVEYKERLIYRDSIYIKEVPVPYEVEKVVTEYPTSYWLLLLFAIMVLATKVPKLLKWIKTLKTFDWTKLLFWKNWKKKKTGE